MVPGPEPEDKNRKEDSKLKIDDSALKTDDDDSQNKTMILDSSALVLLPFTCYSSTIFCSPWEQIKSTYQVLLRCLYSFSYLGSPYP